MFVALFIAMAGIALVASAGKAADEKYNRPAGMGRDSKPNRAMMDNPLMARFFVLAKLYERDQAFPPGQKKFLTRAMAHELHDLCVRLRLPKTALALELDEPLPK